MSRKIYGRWKHIFVQFFYMYTQYTISYTLKINELVRDPVTSLDPCLSIGIKISVKKTLQQYILLDIQILVFPIPSFLLAKDREWGWLYRSYTRYKHVVKGRKKRVTFI